MFEIFLILVAFVGSILAGVIDLKTTEIPDQIPYVMIGIGIFTYGIESFLIGSYSPILFSFIFGLAFLVFGFFMYYMGLWGGGDAKLLSAIGVLLPSLPEYLTRNLIFPFSISFFFNLFLIGSIYMIGYAIFLAFKNQKIWEVFIHDIKANAKMLVFLNVLIAIALIAFGLFALRFFYYTSLFEMVKTEIMIVVLIFSLFLIWRFTKTVEDIGFRKKIPVSKLREGDVLLRSRIWEGLTKEQVARIKHSKKKYIWIKEGVRFGLAFPLALLFTFLIGDGILLVFGFF